MALQGTIKDFGLGEIFQLIGIQRKTGVLTLESGSETVSIHFVDGHVVGADLRERTVEELLGAVLVRTGRITEAQLHEALRIQRRTLQRLGHVLVEHRLISVDDLVDGLRTQALQIVYRLFRWRTGAFRFRTAEHLEYDERHFTPIAAETILMEGARMVDEWPIVERRVRSEHMVFRRTPAGDALCGGIDAILDRDVAAEPAPLDAPARRGADRPASAEEREILALVDGTRTVTEICDRSSLGEFDTWRALADLVTWHWIVEYRKPALALRATRASRWLARGIEAVLCGLVLLAAGVSVFNAPQAPLAPWAVFGGGPTVDALRRHASQLRIEHVERAIQLYYLDRGAFPSRLEALVGSPYIAVEDLGDPLGQPYGYEIDAAGYRIFDPGVEDARDPAPVVEHRFTALQRSMAGSPPSAAPPAP